MEIYYYNIYICKAKFLVLAEVINFKLEIINFYIINKLYKKIICYHTN